MDDISRDVAEDIGPDGIDVRLYDYNGDNLPSVTSILKTRDDDKSALYNWQDENDGTGDNADHNYLFWYSRHLGTLAHWHALTNLDQSLDWSEDEAASEWALTHIDDIEDDRTYHATDDRLQSTGESLNSAGRFAIDGSNHEEIHDATPREVLYSVLKEQHIVESWGDFYDLYTPHGSHDYYTDALVEKAERDIEFFTDAQSRLWSKLGLTDENLVAVEQYLFNDRDNYAGQVDLVYEDGVDTVVADLKTSSGCYRKHKLQGAAYANAIEYSDNVDVDSVDRLEVHRAHPNSGEMAVHSSENIRAVHTDQYWDDSYETLWKEFERLADDFEYEQ